VPRIAQFYSVFGTDLLYGMSKYVDVNIGLDDVDRDGIIDDIVSTELERNVMRLDCLG
jgi:hypothetical protein